jgi:hypothetical protein
MTATSSLLSVTGDYGPKGWALPFGPLCDAARSTGFAVFGLRLAAANARGGV